MSQKPDKVHVKIEYKGAAQAFTAEPQETWFLLNKFFMQQIPTFEVAQKLVLHVDLLQLAKDLVGVVGFSEGTACLLLPKSKLTDNEALLIWLCAQFLGSELGLLARDSMSKDQLQTKLGKTGKITSTRLGELVKSEMVAKTADDQFKVTAFGVIQAQKEMIPKIRQKASA